MALNNYQDADFTPDITPSDVRPNMGTYNSPQTFRFWCQKVLPLVYDDSLSYYELLCKVVDYLNKTMEDVNTAVQDVENLNNAFGSLENHVNASETALLQAYNDLQDYVNSYFNNLDVQEEINNKLDVMASDGTLDALLLPYFNEYTETTNQIIDNRFNEQDSILNTQNSRISVLESRMDGFTTLPDGSTTGDAELQDIRIAADGANYPNAGDAVRGQVRDLKTNLMAINNYTDSSLIDFNSATTQTAWQEKLVMDNITLDAYVAYKITVDFINTINNSTYLYIYDNSDTQIKFYQVGNGASKTECIFENTIQRTGVKLKLSSSGANITGHITLNKYNPKTEDICNNIIPITYVGKYLNLSYDSVDINNPQASAVGMNISIYPCVENDAFTVNASGSSVARTWGFIKSDGTIIVVAPENVTCTNEIIIAPPETAYLIIQDNSNRTSYIGKTIEKKIDESQNVTPYNGFIFDENEPATFVLGKDVSISTGEYIPLSWAATFDEKSFCKIKDNISQIKISTTISSGVYIRFYDEDLNILGNGGYRQSQNITAYVLASMNPNLSKDAKYFKVGIEKALYTDPTLITYVNATPGKFIKLNSETVNAKTLNNIGVFSPLTGRINSYDAETAHHKYFTILFGTDLHGDYDRLSNFEKFANLGDGEKYYSLFDIAINGGDVRHYRNTETDCGWYNTVALGGLSWLDSVTDEFKIPYMYTIGNHDVGFTSSINCLTDTQCHDIFFKNTILYNEAKKPYGYYDNDEYKIRIINLYDYDSGLLDLANTYEWSTLPVIRGYGVIFRQAQLDWFAQTLNSVPANYKVVVLSHNAPLYRENYINFNFDFTDANFNPNSWSRNSYAVQGFRNSDGGGMGVIADIVQAYINKTAINETYSYVGNDYWGANLGYWSDVTANYNFSNANGEFAFYLCGHVHRDVVAACTMTGYEKQKLVCADTGSIETYQRASALSICRNIGAESENSLLGIVINTDNNTLNLINIGATLTSNNEEKATFTLDISMN